jgi:hypothetical protein
LLPCGVGSPFLGNILRPDSVIKSERENPALQGWDEVLKTENDYASKDSLNVKYPGLDEAFVDGDG